jgi:adenosylcobinamide kinase/adenosylcobinamide-phosphate guanylyltransferase
MAPNALPAARPHVTLLLGGVRSGKSARALALAERAFTGTSATAEALFVATAQAFDDEMTRKIAAHRAERSAAWATLESPADVPVDLARALDTARTVDAMPNVVVIDCMTLWVSNLLLGFDETVDVEAAVADQVRALLAVIDSHLHRPTRYIIVSNEVGLGVVPATALGRRFRDALGRANQLIAARADDVTLMVAGLVLPLKHGAES